MEKYSKLTFTEFTLCVSSKHSGGVRYLSIMDFVFMVPTVCGGGGDSKSARTQTSLHMVGIKEERACYTVLIKTDQTCV